MVILDILGGFCPGGFCPRPRITAFMKVATFKTDYYYYY